MYWNKGVCTHGSGPLTSGAREQQVMAEAARHTEQAVLLLENVFERGIIASQ